MKKTLMIVALAIAALAGSAFAGAGDKVLVCHEGSLISVGLSALHAHIAHGDTPYICE